MNISRIGNWAADDYEIKQKRIKMFMDQTNTYIDEVRHMKISTRFKKTFNAFDPVFRRLYIEATPRPTNTAVWAETMMTWGNILMHRASLLD